MSLLMASLQGLSAGAVKPGLEAPQGLEAPGTQGLSYRGSRLRPLQSARACLTPVHVHVRAHARSGPQVSVVRVSGSSPPAASSSWFPVESDYKVKTRSWLRGRKEKANFQVRRETPGR